jgi:hypothetical protein
VKVRQLEQKINKMAPIPTKVICKSWPTTFNTDTEQQWRLNQHLLLEEEFVNAVNFFHNVRNPDLGETPISQMTHQTTEKDNDDHKERNQEEEQEVENDFKEVNNLLCTHKSGNSRRKMIKLCRHKLQRRAINGHKIRARRPRPQEVASTTERELAGGAKKH